MTLTTANSAFASPAYSQIPAVDCVINPFQVADIASPVPGVLELLHVKRSQQVEAGQILAQLDSDVEYANVILARYRADIRSEIELSRINVDFDASRKDRFSSLYQQQVVAVDDVDEVERESQLSRWRLEQARELAKVRQLELKRAEEQLGQKTIRAPFEGFVIDTFKYPGEHVEDQAILRLAQLNPLVVEAIVPMEHFGDIQRNMLAEVVPEMLIKEKLSAKVSIIDRIGDTASNTFGVRLVLDNPDNRIPAGLKCVVKFLDEIAPEPEPEPETEPVIEAEPELVNDEPALTVEAAIEEIRNKQPAETAVNADTPVASTENPVEEPAAPLEVSAVTADSYLVLSEQGETGQATQQLISRFQDAGYKDLFQISRGPYKGLISLGLFSSRQSADNYRQQLEELGFNVFIRQRL
ncbi:MAG: efflux RND transporter periplasmic adaptor subunit [Gammaproteobacteria bacterium]|nr:efflux RND transporter periplasmic adaptor subunit [Gammaproteobacteria bacterium]